MYLCLTYNENVSETYMDLGVCVCVRVEPKH